MKILVIGGMHGNEPLGLSVVQLFKKNPVKDIVVVLANERAIAGNCRFTETDLNRSFPGDETSKVYEQRRAAKLLELTRQYDIVLDFHNTYCPGNDCGFVGETAGRQLFDVAGELGLRRIIVADYDCINKYAPNCLSVEISLDSPLNKPGLWYLRIKSLSELKDVNTSRTIEKYRFAYRITLEDRDKYQLALKELRAFEALDDVLAEEMGVESPAYPIFVNDKFTPHNYGGLLNKINLSYNGENHGNIDTTI